MSGLYPYQRIGAEWLAGRTAGLLADQMGLGKTVQAVIAAKQSGAEKIGVVCPASMVTQWQREFDHWWPEHPPVMVSSYGKVANGHWGVPRFDVLIVDEAHMLKSPTSERTKAIYGPDVDGIDGLVGWADRVWLLTGTPGLNNPAEIWTHLHALMPSALLGKNGKAVGYWGFAKRYTRVFDRGYGPEIKPGSGRNLDELKALIAPFILRRLKADVLADLPPITFNTLYLDGKLPGVSAHDEMLVRNALDSFDVDGLAKVQTHVASLRRETGMAKLPAVVDWIENFLADTDEKLVVFAHHRDVIRELGERFGYGTVVLTGDTQARHRQEVVDLFQNDPRCRLFIGQIQAAGTGLTLTAASTVLMAEQSWVPAENAQAAMRVHRIGQKNACTVYNAVLAGSIDERIGDALTRKLNDLVRLFGDV